MKRYFYRKPLAVEWMRSEFDMDFTSEDGREVSVVDGAMLADAWSGNCESVEKAYIHPESLHLLEPKGRDGLYGPCGGEFVAVADPRIFGSDHTPEEARNAIKAGWRIIQRNGVAFHWPESEEA